MKITLQFIAALFFLQFFNTNFAATGQQIVDIGDFELENGQVIKNCKIGFRTFGSLNSDSSNIVLYPTWYNGTSEHIAKLIGADKLIDSTDFFIIAVDAFGNGISSSPSNSPEQPGQEFPVFTIRDLVRTQYKLLVEYLKIKHLYGAIGGSMGSMQVFEWLVSYPDFIDKAIPYVCTPRSSAQDLLYMNLRKQIIESGQNCAVPEREILKTLNMLTALVARTPEFRIQNTEYDAFPDFLAKFEVNNFRKNLIDDQKSQLLAMLSHDITYKYGGSMEKAAAAIKAQVFIIVSESDHILNPQPAKELASILNCKVMILQNNCGHLAIGCDLEKCSDAISRFFKIK